MEAFRHEFCCLDNPQHAARDDDRARPILGIQPHGPERGLQERNVDDKQMKRDRKRHRRPKPAITEQAAEGAVRLRSGVAGIEQLKERQRRKCHCPSVYPFRAPSIKPPGKAASKINRVPAAMTTPTRAISAHATVDDTFAAGTGRLAHQVRICRDPGCRECGILSCGRLTLAHLGPSHGSTGLGRRPIAA